jgi:hypothetical protein
VARPLVELDICRSWVACECQLRDDESRRYEDQVKCPTWDAVLASDLPCCAELYTGNMSAARYASIFALCWDHRRCCSASEQFLKKMACRSRSKLAMKSSETVLCDGMLMASFG